MISEVLIKTRVINDVPKNTTAGWKLQANCKDISTSWVPPKNLKVLNPIELIKHAINNKIRRKKSYHWWVKDIAQKQDQIISKVVKKCWKISHKFGITVTKTIDKALQIEKEKGTDLWRRLIEEEMLNI